MHKKSVSITDIISLSLFFLLMLTHTLTQAESQVQASPLQKAYRLGAGDLLKITVFNQEDLSGEYTISGSGYISLPLIGSMTAKNLTLQELKKNIVNQLKPDYLLNPRVNIEVLNYRPYYIMGEVNEPQSYPYVDGMTYLNAVVISGGYTYRAKKEYVIVIRADDPSKNELELTMDDKVMPGDIIRIEERFF